MTMGTERSSSSSKALHNFTMPSGLRWGNQKFLRCMKVNADGQISAVERKQPSSYSSYSYAAAGGGGSRVYVDNKFIRRKTEMGGDGGGGSRADVYSEMIRRQTEKFGSGRSDDHMYCFNDSNKKREMGLLFRPPLPPEKRLRVADGGGDDDGIGIAEVREKVILDLRTAADKMKDAILRREGFGDDAGETPAPSPAEEGVRPWNLRTRRAASSLAGGGSCGAAGGGEKNLKVDVIKPNFNALAASPLRVAGETTPRLRSGGAVAAAASPSGENKERAKFSVPLTRSEIEEDFMAMVGHRPPRRPKKRAKYIQKTLDTLFPGLWLTEITADIYKVPETQ